MTVAASLTAACTPLTAGYHGRPAPTAREPYDLVIVVGRMMDPESGLATENGAAWSASTGEVARIRQGVEYGLVRGALSVGLDLGYHELGTSPWDVVEVFHAAASFPGAPVHAALRKTPDHWLETGEVFLAARSRRANRLPTHSGWSGLRAECGGVGWRLPERLLPDSTVGSAVRRYTMNRT
jgi:hypothetical protein